MAIAKTAKRLRGVRLVCVAALAAFVAGCATPNKDDSGESGTSFDPLLTNPLTFQDWLKEFRSEAVASGVSGATYDAATQNISLNMSVLQSNDFQPEFTKQIWDYVDGAVSDFRITKAREKRQQHAPLLAEIERAYGVQSNYVLAIWGLESSFGSFLGNIYAIEALATLGYQGRRAKFGREQMIAALKIIDDGYATRDQLRGSWAGAMGHTQFIPTTYLNYAIDHNDDNRKDLWNDLGDVFASTSNYLAKSEWAKGKRWGVEVSLPEGFDYSLADKANVRSVADWRRLNISGVRGATLAPYENETAFLLIPAGHTGPAFLAFNNFNSILRYNNSTAYALAVGHLAERINGGPAFAGAWPRSETSLSTLEREDTQRLLNQLGFDSGEVDGVIGAKTRSAARLYQKTKGLPADGFVSRGLLNVLRRDVSS
jgi:membrane-bound lytic murein transglycosylase B